MRPSTRHVAAIGRLHVSGRSTSSYVCTQCQLATQRLGLTSLRSANSFVRYASSDKPPENSKVAITERFRRRIWGTDNPPGQKDPYSKASPEELARMEEEELRLQEEEARAGKAGSKWFQRKIQQPSESLEGTEPAETAAEETKLVTQEQDDESDLDPDAPIMIPTTAEAEELGYVPATTWDGLPRVGVKYDAVREAQAFMNDNPFVPYIKPKKVKPAAVQRIVKQALSAALNPQESEVFSGDAAMPTVQPITDQWTAADGSVYRMEGELQSSERPWTEFDLSQDLAFRFAFIKQLMRLSKTRIPDPVIASFSTTGDVVRFLETPPAPTQLAELLLQQAALRALPNVEIKRRTRSRVKIDDERGVAKLIRRELRSRDLVSRRGPSVDTAAKVV